MRIAFVSEHKPADVAREVERLMGQGCDAFVLRPIDHGGMLDQERLGAARYAAGVQSPVELEDEMRVPSAAVR